MQKFWVVTSNSWNGEFDCVSVVGVFDETTAKEFIAEKAKENIGSSYRTTYECEEFKLNEIAR